MKLGDTIFNGNQFKNVILNSTSYKRLILGVNLVWSYFGIAIKSFKTRILADSGTYEAESILEDRLQEITPNLFASASLVITPNGVKTSKLYAIKPDNGSGDLTVVRATTATRVDENGNIVDVPANVARLDYSNGSRPSILVEPLLTNYWANNNNTNGYTNNTGAIKGNQVINAFGNGVNGYQYTFDSTGKSFVGSEFSIRTFDTRTFPVNRLCLFIKNPSSDYFSINFSFVAQATFRFSNLTSYDSNGSIVKINNNTYALYVHYDTSITAQFSQVRCSFVSGFSVNPVPINGTAILGLGFWYRATSPTQVPNVYSPIITTTSAVTRNADVISKSGLSGITTITETFENGTTNVINGSPTTYQMSNGRIKKVIGK